MTSSPAHAGVLVPWANTVVEAELHQVTGAAVIWHYSRLVPGSLTTELDRRFLTGLLGAVPGALAQLAALPLRRVYLACTSAAFMYPDRAERARADAAVHLVSAFDAITAALSHAGATRIVLLTPYPQEVTETESAMFTSLGFEVTARACIGSTDGYSKVTLRQIWELAGSVDSATVDDADAVVLSCTGWPTLAMIPDLERSLRKPVISSNLAIGLHARREGNH
ncbi:MAG: aspartate/glutamate racemase family protein [Nocardiopsaceae bacterium]|nr:aspartate/glutamate racemase family protein [Nocardiopsaceae bacterium]